MANEKRLIDANAYCKELYAERDYPGRTEEFISALEVAIADLGDMPTVDAVEVVHGRWENFSGGIMITLGDCSECKVRQPVTGTNYCKNCGAKMDKNENP